MGLWTVGVRGAAQMTEDHAGCPANG